MAQSGPNGTVCSSSAFGREADINRMRAALTGAASDPSRTSTIYFCCDAPSHLMRNFRLGTLLPTQECVITFYPW